MKNPLGLALASAVLVLPGAVCAQVVGGAVEYWTTRSDYNVADEAGNTVAKGTIKYDQPGFHVYGGTGDFIVFAAARAGDGDLDLAYAPGSIAGASFGPVTTRTRVEQEDRELGLRWTVYRSQQFSAYLVGGYAWTDYEEQETLTNNPELVWGSTGSRTRSDRVEYRGPLIGIGTARSFGERFGLRFEARLKFYDAERTASGRAAVSDHGIGGDMTSAAYLNITEGLSLQLGGRFTHLDGGDAVSAVSRWSWFGTLGYASRF
jgi:hypothetical protein